MCHACAYISSYDSFLLHKFFTTFLLRSTAPQPVLQLSWNHFYTPTYFLSFFPKYKINFCFTYTCAYFPRTSLFHYRNLVVFFLAHCFFHIHLCTPSTDFPTILFKFPKKNMIAQELFKSHSYTILLYSILYTL